MIQVSIISPGNNKNRINGMVSYAFTGSRVVPWFTCREDTGQGKDDGVWELYNRVTEMAGCYFVITRDIPVNFHPVYQLKGAWI